MGRRKSELSWDRRPDLGCVGSSQTVVLGTQTRATAFGLLMGGNHFLSLESHPGRQEGRRHDGERPQLLSSLNGNLPTALNNPSPDFVQATLPTHPLLCWVNNELYFSVGGGEACVPLFLLLKGQRDTMRRICQSPWKQREDQTSGVSFFTTLG